MRQYSKYAAIFKTQVVNGLAYPAEMIWRSLMIILFMWIFAFLWRATYKAAGTDMIAGLTLHDTLWYLLVAEVIELSRPRIARSIAESVKDGSIAYLLNKPYNFLLYHLGVSLGDGFFRTLLNTFFGGAIVWLLAGPPPSPRGWFLVIIAGFFAWLIYFCLNAMIGLAAFITEEVAPFEWVLQKLSFILGGMLIPLDFYPPWLQSIARALPFAYAIYGPARLFVTPDLERFLTLIIGQLIWLAVLGGLLALFYRLGVNRLNINGG